WRGNGGIGRIDSEPRTRGKPRNESLHANTCGRSGEVVVPPDDDAVGRAVRDDPDVAREVARTARAPTESGLEHSGGDALAQRPAKRRERRHDNGGDVTIGEERNCRG